MEGMDDESTTNVPAVNCDQGVRGLCEEIPQDGSQSKAKRLPRSEKKRRKRQQLIANRKEVRKEKRLAKKTRKSEYTVSDKGAKSEVSSLSATVELTDNSAAESRAIESARIDHFNKKALGRDSLKDCKAVENVSSTSFVDETGRRCKGHLLRKQRLVEIQRRCKEALISGQRVCIDCSLGGHMTEKQCNKLAQQIGRLYGSNRKARNPLHIYLSGMKKDEVIYKECVRKNMGFDDYIMDICEENYDELFKRDELVYLTPDSETVLETLDKDKVYIIGGLVDETTKKNLTVSNAEKFKLNTARFPIDEYMTKVEGGNYKKVLTVNQVVDILLTFAETGDWTKALEAGVPKRTGFVIKETE